MKFLLLPITLIGSLAIIIWLIVPTYNEAARIKNVDLVAARNKLKTEQEINKNIASFREDYEAKKDNLRVAKYALPEEDDAKSLLVQMETIFANNGVAYDDITIQQIDPIGVAPGFVPPLAEGSFSQIPTPQPLGIKAKIIGPYEGIAGFVSDIEDLNRLCNLTALKIEVDEAGKSNFNEEQPDTGVPDMLSGELEFTAYKQEAMKPEAIRQAFQRNQQPAPAVTVPADGI